MDVTMVGLQNAGKTSLLRVLAVSRAQRSPGEPPVDGLGPPQLTTCLQGGEFTIE